MLVSVIFWFVVYTLTQPLSCSLQHEFEWNKYRLPTAITPNEYSIRLILDMFGNEDVNMELPYSGSVNISLYFNESTDLIVLHSVSLNITKVKVETQTDSSPDVLNYRHNDKMEQLEVKLDRRPDAGTEMNLQVEFMGLVSDQLQGFYKGTYRLSESK
ncbi:ENPEP [Bugula neritina]|uniref:ENPEP n=1 Tax=Bugula neritina TaxID=10212 RepID=A0A7J7KJ31_BUGNE|nr:ENPEP [Bugula neritina]